jgi:hypothetical protein
MGRGRGVGRRVAGRDASLGTRTLPVGVRRGAGRDARGAVGRASARALKVPDTFQSAGLSERGGERTMCLVRHSNAAMMSVAFAPASERGETPDNGLGPET